MTQTMLEYGFPAHPKDCYGRLCQNYVLFIFFLHVTSLLKDILEMNNYEFYSLGHMVDLYNILNWKRVQD